MARCQATIIVDKDSSEGKFTYNLFKSWRKRLIKLCIKVNILLPIPIDTNGQVDLHIEKNPNESYEPNESEFDTETEYSDNKTESFSRTPSPFLEKPPSPVLSRSNTSPRTPSPITAQITAIQLCQFISSHLKDFDRNPSNLQTFLDRIDDIEAVTPQALDPTEKWNHKCKFKDKINASRRHTNFWTSKIKYKRKRNKTRHKSDSG